MSKRSKFAAIANAFTRSPIYGPLRLLIIAVAILIMGNTVLRTDEGRAGSPVDLLLVISLDVSASVDVVEYELMVEGLANALASPSVTQAVMAGKNGAIAINILQWSGFTEQDVKIDWRRVASGEDLVALAQDVRKMKRRYNGGATDIGGGIDYAVELLKSAPYFANKRVIDIVGDGPNNVNFSPRLARDRAIKADITINALVISGGIEVLAGYFAEFVVGGSGSFVEKASDFDGFERAIHRKLLREIGNMFLF